jgi:hypothetical protein
VPPRPLNATTYPAMARRDPTFSLLLLTTLLGCSTTPSSPSTRPAPTTAEIQRWDRQQANADRARQLLESGGLHAGQSLDELLKVCTPYRIDFVDRYAFIEFYSVPNLTGLSLVAADGKLASATEWGCVASHEYFSTLSAAEKEAASSAYEARLFGGRR